MNPVSVLVNGYALDPFKEQNALTIAMNRQHPPVLHFVWNR
jgi:hypothetical protein